MSDIFRRDPRTQWIARNRLHPLHVANIGEPERGPSGLLRKNLHNIGFIGANGVKRIDRSGDSKGGLSGRKATTAVEIVLPLHQIDKPDFYILVVVDLVSARLNNHDRDTLGLAHHMANSNNAKGAVVAVLFGEVKEDKLDTAGIDRLIHFDTSAYQSYNPEQRCADLCNIVNELQPKHILLPDSINGGGDLGRRLAAKLDQRPACGVWKVNGEQLVCRGGAGKTDITRPMAKILLVLEECSEPVSETRHQSLLMPVVSSVTVKQRILDLGNMSVDPNAINLAEAGFILSGGNGVKDWPEFHLAAKILGATEGASRVAVDDGFMPRDRQVGASGTWVTARVYIAVGISGAIQHMQGIAQCDKVVAINNNDSCDMVKRADLSAIGDSSEILGELLNVVRQHAAEKPVNHVVINHG
ncbi:electron transfer flavoprotein subunit alpha/FixB family protein [Paraglaciecola sp. MB-3u-78]|uniref:electron transfer flavoprotein subunit alpha n=1 Tax=Paraglaciecola sp. MB-3u-78 TaxID=2058332 RepID=UPI000C338536|nr:electron transfer flavoprotein subunit alpha/FixB family protein [Paraglaciecola sp. MB-3u-78]PKG98885.1 electron transfer flavoprotein subunit alpha [Paraglaciecola sp. MB-3u-78]